VRIGLEVKTGLEPFKECRTGVALPLAEERLPPLTEHTQAVPTSAIGKHEVDGVGKRYTMHDDLAG